MPIYEFQCGGCGKRSDHLMRISDPDPAACPECGAGALTRVLSAPQFRLAGGGWYETDFKSDKDRKRNLAGDGGDKGGDKASSSPEAKPAAKSEGASAPAAVAPSTPAKSD